MGNKKDFFDPMSPIISDDLEEEKDQHANIIDENDDLIQTIEQEKNFNDTKQKSKKIKFPRLQSKIGEWFKLKKTMILKGGIGFLVLLSIIGGSFWFKYYLLASPAFNVKKVEVSFLEHDISVDIKKITDPLLGKNIFLINLNKLENDIKKIPWIKNVKAWRSLPSTIHLDIIEHRVIAAIYFENRGFFLVNTEGKIFKKAFPKELKGLPIISGISSHQLEQSQLQLKQVLNFLKLYMNKPSRPAISEIRHLGIELSFTLRDSPLEIRISFGNSLKERLESFDRIFKILSKDLTEKTIVFIDISDKPQTIIVKKLDEIKHSLPLEDENN